MRTTINLNRTFDLFSLVERDTTLRKTGSGWWAGPCPFCGGKDRFVLKEAGDGWRWFCRGCGGDQYHTAVDYMMKRDNLDFQEAYKRMIAGSVARAGDQRKAAPMQFQPESARPSDAWHARALTFIDDCESMLWSDAGVLVLAYLHGRGLKEDSLRRFRIGYNPAEKFEPLEDWGLSDPGDGKRHAVWMPRGVVLPCFAGGVLWYVKFRRPLTQDQEKAGEQKYIKVKGSKPGIFGADNLRGAWLAVLTEGEFDCMLLHQQAGDLAEVATLGSATDRLSRLDMGIWGRYLLPVAHFLAAYDSDTEGQKGLRALEGFTERVQHAPLPELPNVKDITDLWKAGGDLGGWIACTIEALGLLESRAQAVKLDFDET